MSFATAETLELMSVRSIVGPTCSVFGLAKLYSRLAEWADRIIFLGFSYDERNLQKLGNLKSIGKSLAIACLTRSRASIAERFQALSPGSIWLDKTTHLSMRRF